MSDQGKTWHCVSDPQAASLLLTWHSRPVIAPFLEGECSASSVAQALDISLSGASRLIRRLLHLGLIREVGRRPRRGRPQSLYRAVAGGFFVPFSQTQGTSVAQAWADDEERLARHLAGHVTARLRRHAPDVDDWGNTFTLDDRGRLQVDFARRPDHPAPFTWPADLVSWWASLTLTPPQATELGRELQDLFGRYYETPPAGGTQRYLLRLALAPVQEDGPEAP